MQRALAPLALLCSAATVAGQSQVGASWPTLGGSTLRSGAGQGSGPTDSSVELKWSYALTSDTSSSGPSPVVDSSGNIVIVTSGGTLRSLSTTSATNPSPLFSGTLRDGSALGACTAIPLVNSGAANPTTSGVFTYTYTAQATVYTSGQAVYVGSLGGCTAGLSTSAMYYFLPLTSTTFSLSASQSTLSAITSIVCSGTPPTLVTAFPGAQLTIPYPGAVLAAGTTVALSLPCTPSPCTNAVLTSSVLSVAATQNFQPTSISGGNFVTTASVVSSLSTATGAATQFIFTSLGQGCVTTPSLSLTTTYTVSATSTPSFTFTALGSTTAVVITSCTTFPTIAVQQLTYSLTPTVDAAKYSVTGIPSAGTLTVGNAFSAWQPFIFTSIGSGCTSGAIALSTVYYVVTATSTSITFTGSQFGVAATSLTACTTSFPVLQAYTQSSGCITGSSATAVSGVTPLVSFTTAAPPVLNWAGILSGTTFALNGVTQSPSLSNTFQPILATPAIDNSGLMWLPVGANLVAIRVTTGALVSVYGTSCPVVTTTGSFTASITGTTLSITSIVNTFTGYLTTTGTLQVSTGTPYLPIGAYLTAAVSPSTTIIVIGTSGSQYIASLSPALGAGLGSSASPVAFTVTLPPGLVLSATGLAVGTTIVSGSGSSYIVSLSQTLASTTMTSITGLPTSPVVDASGNVVFTCGNSIVFLPSYSGTNGPTTVKWNQLVNSASAQLSSMAYSPRTGYFYAGDASGSVWAWSLASYASSSQVSSWFTAATQQWTWPPSPWPTGVLASLSGLSAALQPPVVGSSYSGPEQVYVTMCTPNMACFINALAAATGADNWLYGTSPNIMAGFPLGTCYPTAASAYGSDKVAIVCGIPPGSPASATSTLQLIFNTLAGGLSFFPVSGYKFSTPAVVDASGSTLYFGGRDGCLTGLSLASKTATWQMPSGCTSSTTLSSFAAVQPALTAAVSAATLASTGSSGTPGYLVAVDTGLSVTAYGRYGSATPTASATASGSVSLSVSVTVRPSASPTATLSGSACPSTSLSASPTPTVCATASPSLSATLSASPSLSPTLTASLSATTCVTQSTSASASLSATSCVTQSTSATVTPSTCATATLSASPSSAASASSSLSPSLSPTTTNCLTSTLTPSLSASTSPSTSSSAAFTLSYSLPPTSSAAPTPTSTLTGSPTPTGTPSQTPTQTPSFTPWAKAAAAAAAAAASASGSGGAAGGASLESAGIAMVVIGTIFLVAACALYYVYLKHPEKLRELWEEVCGGARVSKGRGGVGAEDVEGGGGGGSSAAGGASGSASGSNSANARKSSSSSKFPSRLDGSSSSSSSGTGYSSNPMSDSRGALGAPSPYSSHYMEDGGLYAEGAGGAAVAASGKASSKASRYNSSTLAAGGSTSAATPLDTLPAAGEALSIRSTSASRSASRAARREEAAAEEEALPTPRSASAQRRGSYSAKRSSSSKQASQAGMYDDWTTQER